MLTEQAKRTLPNFNKFFPNEFVGVLTSLGSKRADILAFILKSRRRSDNFFVGSYDVIAKNTNTSIHTVSDTINILLNTNFMRRIAESTYMINPAIIVYGGQANEMMLNKEYADVNNTPFLYPQNKKSKNGGKTK